MFQTFKYLLRRRCSIKTNKNISSTASNTTTNTSTAVYMTYLAWPGIYIINVICRCSPSITLQQKYASSTWFYFDLVEKNNNTLIDLLYTRTIVGWLTAHNCYFIQTLYQHNYLHEYSIPEVLKCMMQHRNDSIWPMCFRSIFSFNIKIAFYNDTCSHSL